METLKLPDALRKGDSYSWTVELPLYTQSGGWSLEYTFRIGNSSISVPGTDAGSGVWTFSISTTVSNGFYPGLVNYAVIASATGQRKTLFYTTVDILPDIDTLTSQDGSTHAARMVRAIEALLENKASNDIAAMSHNGKSLSRYSIPDLIQLHNHYRAMLQVEQARERARLGVATGNKKLHRFRG